MLAASQNLDSRHSNRRFAAEPNDAVRSIAAAGAELILFTAMFEQAEHAERLAAEVIPQLG